MQNDNPLTLTFVKEFGHLYLVLPANEPDCSRHIIQMQKHNEIYGLLPMKIRTINNVSGYYYEIGSYKSILDYYESKKLTYRELKELIKDLRKIIKELESYILDCEHLYLSHDCVFIHPLSRKLTVVYYPENTAGLNAGLRRLATGLLDLVANDDEAAVSLAYSFYQLVYSNQFVMEEIEMIHEETGSEMSDDKTAFIEPEIIESLAGVKPPLYTKNIPVITVENISDSVSGAPHLTNADVLYPKRELKATEGEDEKKGNFAKKNKINIMINLAFIAIPLLVLALHSKYDFLTYAQILIMLGISGVFLAVFLFRYIFVKQKHILFR